MRTIRNHIGTVTKVFGEIVEQEAIDQITELAEFEPYLHTKIRIMPDVHAGKGCTVGTTMTVSDKLTPNLVGVDIGCGMYVVPLGKGNLDLLRLDEVINERVPSGTHIHASIKFKFQELEELRCIESLNMDKANASIGTLGGGNHFIEVDLDSEGIHYLVIHSGSRNLGVKVCNHYQCRAVKDMSDTREEVSAVIAKLKAEGREREIEAAIKSIKAKEFPERLAYVSGEALADYLHDMAITQRYASFNRETMAHVIVDGLGLRVDWTQSFHTVHNYIDVDNGILRKGAVSAQAGERLIIPMNMRDGSLICIGKGNADWNYSAPHGAGRLMSRSKAKEAIPMTDFTDSMSGIYTTSVCEATLDEAPQAYKPMEMIVRAIEPTATIERIIRPLYNFKAKD